MSADRKEPPKKPEPADAAPKKTAEQLKTETYTESAKAVREVSTRVMLSVGVAALIWIFAVFLRLGTIIFPKFVNWLLK